MYIVATGTLGRYMVVVCRRAEVKPEPPSNNSSQHRESRSQPNITPQWVVQIGGKMLVNKTRIIIVYSVFKDPLQTCFKMYIKHFALIHNVVLISIFPQKVLLWEKNITAFLSLKTQILLKSQFSTQKRWIRSYLNVRLVYSSRKVVFILKYIWYQVLCFTRVIFLHDIFTFPLVWPMRTLVLSMRAFEASGFRTCVCENIDLRTICDVTHQAHTAASTKIGFSASTKKMYTCRLMSDSTQTSFRTVKVKHATVATRLKKRIKFLRERGTLMLRSSQRDSPVSRFEMPKVNTKLFGECTHNSTLSSAAPYVRTY